MPNVMIAGRNHGFANGTIAAGGTLSQEICIGEYSMNGLIVSQLNGTLTTGTLTFYVSAYSENDTRYTANYVQVKDSANAAVSFVVSGAQALKGTDLEFLAPYQYCKLNMSTTQTNGVQFTFAMKG